MILYHHTSRHHLPLIMADGFLKTVESELKMPDMSVARTATNPLDVINSNSHAGPDVVWFTTSRERRQRWMKGTPVDKGEVTIMVDLDDAMPWLEWAKQYGGVDAAWVAALTGGHPEAADEWYVVERPVHRNEFIDIIENDAQEARSTKRAQRFGLCLTR